MDQNNLSEVMKDQEKKVEEMMKNGKKQPKIKKTGAKFDSANH